MKLNGILLLAAPSLFASTAVRSPSGTAVQLDSKTGAYQVAVPAFAWTFEGRLGGPAESVVQSRGTDRIGAYRQIAFSFGNPAAKGRMAGSLRAYDRTPAVLFSVTCLDPAGRLPIRFPDFTAFPKGLHPFSYRDSHFAPPSFSLEPGGTPWLLFDDRARAAILSPASDFMISSMDDDGGRLASGLNPQARDLPAGFAHRTLLVFSQGINAAWDTWGRALTDLSGKVRPPNDADIGLRYLGYWTDNGAAYYYHYDPALGYAGTLAELVGRYRKEGIPIHYLQLDSWWYEKTLTGPDGRTGRTKNPELPAGQWNRYGGLLRYEPDPALFPHGLSAFSRRIGLPLITHNRWIDPASPYRRGYAISGFAAVDPRWWDHVIGAIGAAGVVCYEQDWLDEIYLHSPALGASPAAGDAFTGGMARAAAERGLSVQYCMALPRYFLQGSRYGNLTTIRTSDDRFGRRRWDDFLFTSRLAAAVGIWPWTDVFMSRETDNLLISTLSAGMVGIGDPMGREDRTDLLRAVRADGVIVKPDASLVPSDRSYLARARETGAPMVAWAHTDHGPLRTAYVFAYARKGGTSSGAFSPKDFGFDGEVAVYDTRSGAAKLQAADEPFRFVLPAGGTGYFLLAPVGRSGLAFFGDEGKFVSNGRKRIASMEETADGLRVAVVLAACEKSVRVFGYARTAPTLRSIEGAASGIEYDPRTLRFEATVSPAPQVKEEMPGGDPIREAAFLVRGG